MKSKIQIAKDFIALHKNDNSADWFMQCLKGEYLEVYARLKDGVYGECRDNAEYDEDGEIIKEPTEFEVEISSFDSKTGSPELFVWYE